MKDWMWYIGWGVAVILFAAFYQQIFAFFAPNPTGPVLTPTQELNYN